MSFKDTLVKPFIGVDHWLHNHFHKHYDWNTYFNLEHFSHHWYWICNNAYFPDDVLKQIYSLYLKEHEVFLSEHFVMTKKVLIIRHKLEALYLELSEHSYKTEEYDKKYVAETLRIIQDLKKDMVILMDQEQARFKDHQSAAEYAALEIVEHYLYKV